MPLPTVSVVIATHQRRSRLQRAVEPLLADPDLLEVVVVVDGSRDGSIELLEEMSERDDRLKPLFNENRGDIGARYAGVEAAQGDVIIILDDDEVARGGLARGHAAHHAGAERKVVAGYYPTTLPAQRTADNFATFVYDVHYEAACREYERDPDSILLRLQGGHFSMRRDDYLRVGREWWTNVHGYHSDLDFGVRCLRDGLTGVFDRSLVVDHEYHRPLGPFLADARSSGVNRSMVHWLHPDLLGPMAADHYERGLPAFARAVVRSARRPRAEGLWRRLLYRAVVAFGRLRLFKLQTRSAQLLRRIEHQRGAIEFADDLASGRGAASRSREPVAA